MIEKTVLRKIGKQGITDITDHARSCPGREQTGLADVKLLHDYRVNSAGFAELAVFDKADLSKVSCNVSHKFGATKLRDKFHGSFYIACIV